MAGRKTQLAIKGGKPVRTKPFTSWPIHDEKERKAVLEVLESGKWWHGENVRKFEEEYAAYQDAKFGITSVNGTTALYIALIAAGVGAGDEVIVPPYTFVATASSVLNANAIPIFADIDLKTWNLDPKAAEAAITSRTKAIMPVHFGGLPADMDRINRIAKKHNLMVIEDAAHAWGTKWRGKGAGALGHLGGFSFQVSKNITAGEGGITLTDDEELADRARSYSNCGRSQKGAWYEHFLLGGNYRMTEFQAAILRCQLKRLPAHVKKREQNAAYLNEQLSQVPGIHTIPNDKRVTQRSYHLYELRFVPEEFGSITLDQFLAAMRAEGVPGGRGYPHPLYKNELFLKKGKGRKFCPVSCPYYGKKIDYSKVFCPNAELLCQQAIFMGHSMLLGTKKDMQDVVRAVQKVYDNQGSL